MKAIRSRYVAVPTALLLAALSCSAEESGGSANLPARVPGEPTSDRGSEALWYRRTRALDLTGDGQADVVRLEAVGTRTDSLRVTLSLLVDGDRKYQEGWGSSYELALVDPAARVPPRADSVLRAQLDGVLASVVFDRLGAPGMRLMAEDSTALAGIEPRPTHGVSFAYGYETTVRLAWDASRSRFVHLWSCC